jgi:hypothetical protein
VLLRKFILIKSEEKEVEIDVNWSIFFLVFAQNDTNKVRFNLNNGVSRREQTRLFLSKSNGMQREGRRISDEPTLFRTISAYGPGRRRSDACLAGE